MVLMPLGEVNEAVPVLLDTVRKDPELAKTASSILPWLCLEQRIKMFRDLHSIATDADARARTNW